MQIGTLVESGGMTQKPKDIVYALLLMLKPLCTIFMKVFYVSLYDGIDTGYV